MTLMQESSYENVRPVHSKCMYSNMAKHLSTAIDIALKNYQTGKIQHGAIIVKGGKVLAHGINSISPSNVCGKRYGCYCHAEQAAVSSIYGRHKKKPQIKAANGLVCGPNHGYQRYRSDRHVQTVSRMY